MIADLLDLASQRWNVLRAGMAASLQIERTDSPHAMRSQILSQIARLSIVGRPGRRFVARIAVAIVAADRLPGKAIKATLCPRAMSASIAKLAKSLLGVQAITRIHRHSPVSKDVRNDASSPVEDWLFPDDHSQLCITFTTAAKATAHT